MEPDMGQIDLRQVAQLAVSPWCKFSNYSIKPRPMNFSLKHGARMCRLFRTAGRYALSGPG